MGQRAFGGSSRPTVASAGVFELQDAAVREVQSSLVECSVDGISSDVSSGLLGKVHDARVANLLGNCWLSFQDETLNLGRDSSAIPSQARQHAFVQQIVRRQIPKT